MPRGSSLEETTILGVRERNLYRIQGNPMKVVERSSRVIEDKEQVAPKVEQRKGSRPSGSGGKKHPSKSVKESWYEMTMQDAQE